MSKKVLMINGSKRKKNTYGLLLQIGDILKKHDVDFEIIDLFDYEIRDCVGCETCVSNKSCGIRDDMPAIMQKILESDGVVLSSPVYMRGVTSKFKAFSDRLNVWIHKPETAGIPMMFAATTASTGLKETGLFFKSLASGLGARRGEFITRTNNSIGIPVRENEMSRFLSLLGRDKKYYSPAIDEIVMFTVGKVLALKSDGDDRKFWEGKQWLDKKYYYPCKMNPGKKLFSKFIFGVLSKAIK